MQFHLNKNEKHNCVTPNFPKRILLGLNDGHCNLKCPACYVHGVNNDKKISKGCMPLENANKIFDEVKDTGIFISPVLWSEPLLIKNYSDYFIKIKQAGLHAFINTNGLILSKKMAKNFISIPIHSIFISIDATTPETLKKVRGIDNLEKIQSSVFMLLQERKKMLSPRIGVSFVESKLNNHEKADFISFWIEHVDVVRVNDVYEEHNRTKNQNILLQRVPCGALYDTMPINHKGDVPICCLDSFNETNMGNVFENGVQGVWLGKKFENVRMLHETGQYNKLPLCSHCDVWKNYLIKETVSKGILIRESPVMTYYNRMDRMYTWHSRIR